MNEQQEELTIIVKNNKVLTEDLGKIFEMAICLLYEIDYDGKYKYSMEDASLLKERISKLRDIFPHKLCHTAKNGSRYDFTGVEDLSIRLSAKTTKKDGKIAPQVIGQPSKKKFCDYFEVPISSSLDEIKSYIIENIKEMLKKYEECTFDCEIIYYNKKNDLLVFIKKVSDIDWSKHEVEFSHIKKKKSWGESSSISIDGITIGEFQVHNHRDCIKFRWAFEKLLVLFKDCFEFTGL
uniref:Uncharacterized protein n=1 Tax=viral metagenome TaxID=1070528 RepID=A0A6C0KYI8_9ZZZZ